MCSAREKRVFLAGQHCLANFLLRPLRRSAFKGFIQLDGWISPDFFGDDQAVSEPKVAAARPVVPHLKGRIFVAFFFQNVVF